MPVKTAGHLARITTDTSRKIDLLATGINAGDGAAADQRLVLQSIRGYEEMSRPFCYELDLLGSASSPLRPTDFVGRAVTIRIGPDSASPRFVNGYVARFARTGISSSGKLKYRATVVPFLWFLSRRKNSRIFADKTVLEIVTEILTEHGFDSRLSTNVVETTYLKPEYTVQYQETDLDFISRLLEHHGLFYYFKHTTDFHSIVIGDSPTQYLGLEQDDEATTADPNDRTIGDVGNSPDQDSYPVATLGPAVGTFCPVDVATDATSPPPDSTGTTGSRMWDWREEYQAMPWSFAAADFDPACALRRIGSTTRVSDLDEPMPNVETTDSTREWYEFGQGLNEIALSLEDSQSATSVGEALSRLRAQRADVAAVICSGTSDHHRMSAGRTIRLSGAGHDSNAEYLVTRVDIRARSDEFDTSGPMTPVDINGELIVCSVRAIPAGTPFRPERVTPKPRIAGPHSAVVVGTSDTVAGIHVDRFGRVKVRFHWDRADAQACRWVRVSQASAGGSSRDSGGDGTWGSMFIPHVDDEVLVEFIDGDPDRPVITGRVYREKDSSPVPRDQGQREMADEDVLPVNKSRGIIKDAGGNYLMMEEKEDAQQIEFYSPKSGDAGINARISLGDGLNGKTYAEIGGSDDAFENPVDGVNVDTSGSVMLWADKTFNMYSGEDFRHSVKGDHFVRIDGNSEVVTNASTKNLKWANETKITLGFTGELYIGFKTEMNIAGAAEIFIGEKFEAHLLSKQELCLGAQEEYAIGLKSEYSAGYKKEYGSMADWDYAAAFTVGAPTMIMKGMAMVPGAFTAIGTYVSGKAAAASAKVAGMSTKTKVAAGAAAAAVVVVGAAVGGAVGGTKHNKKGTGWGD